MGPNNPWSPDWRPDPTGDRLARIRVARRGAVLAAALYLPVSIAAASSTASPIPSLPAQWVAPLAAVAILSGLPGIALLGAGLGPAALGSRVDAAVVGIALAIGAPVAATASFVIWGWVLDSWLADSADFAAPLLRAGVVAALRVAPLVAVGAATWVILVRRLSQAPPRPSGPTGS